jgi:hypothetical protein
MEAWPGSGPPATPSDAGGVAVSAPHHYYQSHISPHSRRAFDDFNRVHFDKLQQVRGTDGPPASAATPRPSHGVRRAVRTRLTPAQPTALPLPSAAACCASRPSPRPAHCLSPPRLPPLLHRTPIPSPLRRPSPLATRQARGPGYKQRCVTPKVGEEPLTRAEHLALRAADGAHNPADVLGLPAEPPYSRGSPQVRFVLLAELPSPPVCCCQAGTQRPRRLQCTRSRVLRPVRRVASLARDTPLFPHPHFSPSPRSSSLASGRAAPAARPRRSSRSRRSPPRPPAARPRPCPACPATPCTTPRAVAPARAATRPARTPAPRRPSCSMRCRTRSTPTARRGRGAWPPRRTRRSARAPRSGPRRHSARPRPVRTPRLPSHNTRCAA